VLIEVSNTTGASASQFTYLIIIWPSGQLQEEEPLKISIDAGVALDDSLPPTIVGSMSKAPLALLGRLCGGKVLCWHFNNACSQLVSERHLGDQAGLVAMSSDGCWVVVASSLSGGGSQLEVWTFNGHGKCDRIAVLSRRPQAMAIIQQRSAQQIAHLDACEQGHWLSSTAWIALCEESAGCPESFVEVLLLHADGSWASAYRVRTESPCRSLMFCHESSTFLLSAHLDGTVILSDLKSGQFRMSHDDVSLRSARASADCSLLITTGANSFRIFRPGSLNAAGDSL